MTEEARAARAAYKREWGRKNPDKIKEQQARYWAKKAAQKQAEDKAKVEKSPEPEAQNDK